jgi:hypothetical protein
VKVAECAQCGQTFWGHGNNRSKFCSTACRQAGASWARPIPTPKPCAYCGRMLSDHDPFEFCRLEVSYARV